MQKLQARTRWLARPCCFLPLSVRPVRPSAYLQRIPFSAKSAINLKRDTFRHSDFKLMAAKANTLPVNILIKNYVLRGLNK